MYFLIFHPADMLKLRLNFSEYQTICAYKNYAYKEQSVPFQSSMVPISVVDFTNFSIEISVKEWAINRLSMKLS